MARIVAETCSKLHVRNSVWTAPARADRMLAFLQKTRPDTPFFKDFDVFLGAKSRHLDHFALAMALFLAAWFGVAVRAMGTVQPQSKPTSSQRVKSV